MPERALQLLTVVAPMLDEEDTARPFRAHVWVGFTQTAVPYVVRARVNVAAPSADETDRVALP